MGTGVTFQICSPENLGSPHPRRNFVVVIGMNYGIWRLENRPTAKSQALDTSGQAIVR
jgi:hypothetical protein